MKKKTIVMISYLSKESEGRLNRHYKNLNDDPHISLVLIQGVRNKDEYSMENNVINVDLEGMKKIASYRNFYLNVCKILKEKKFDFYYLNNYYTACFYKKIPREKLIYDAYELYYPGCGRKLSKRDLIFFYLEKKCIKKAILITSANEARGLVMIGKYNLKEIPCIIGNDCITYNRNEKKVKKLYAAVYIGYLSEERNLLKTIDIIKKINKERTKQIQFHIYGKGVLEEKIKNACKDETNIIFKGAYSSENVGNILAQYSFGYIYYPNTEMNTILCCPNKLNDYINNHVVVFGNKNYSVSKIVNEYKLGNCNDNLELALLDVIDKYETYYENIVNYANLKKSEKGYDELKGFIINGK